MGCTLLNVSKGDFLSQSFTQNIIQCPKGLLEKNFSSTVLDDGFKIDSTIDKCQ